MKRLCAIFLMRMCQMEVSKVYHSSNPQIKDKWRAEKYNEIPLFQREGYYISLPLHIFNQKYLIFLLEIEANYLLPQTTEQPSLVSVLPSNKQFSSTSNIWVLSPSITFNISETEVLLLRRLQILLVPSMPALWKTDLQWCFVKAKAIRVCHAVYLPIYMNYIHRCMYRHIYTCTHLPHI